MIVILTVGDLIDSAKDLQPRDVEIKHVAKRLIVLDAESVLYSKGGLIKVLKDNLYPVSSICWHVSELGAFLEERL